MKKQESLIRTIEKCGWKGGRAASEGGGCEKRTEES